MKKTKGFTLSEVLTALTIIGVIAALTVPALIQRTNKQEYVSALQKAYSTLSQVTNQIIAENGSPKADENGESWLKGHDSLYDMYKKYLSSAKECSSDKGCFEQTDPYGFKYLKGGHHANYNGTAWPTLLLADGTSVLFESYGSGCTANVSGAEKDNDVCAGLFIDVNGARKPNAWGRDAFILVLKKDGLYPIGCTGNSAQCNSNGTGKDCACKVLREGRMDY